MRSTKASIGSLSSMASKVREEKKNGTAAKTDTPLGSKVAKQNKAVVTKANGTKALATPAKSRTKGSIPSSAQKSTSDSDSDSESESESESGSGSGSESESKSKSERPASSRSVAKKSKTAVRKAESGSESTSSSGSTSESEIDSDSDSDSEEKASEPAKKVNGKASANDGNEESESSGNDRTTPSTTALANSMGNGKDSAGTSEESSSEESDSGSESDDEGDGGKTSVPRINGKAGSKQTATQISQVQGLNNSDFTLRKVSSDNPGKEVADLLNCANLEGKQLYYFTVPASFPITVFDNKYIDPVKAIKGEPLVTYNGSGYCIDIEPPSTSTQIRLLIPCQDGAKYAPLNRPVDATFHLRPTAKFGVGGMIPTIATDDYDPVPKSIREQPEGLRVRYTAMGLPPTISGAASTKRSKKASSSKMNAKTQEDVSSSSESAPETDSDVEMTEPSGPAAPTGKAKSTKSDIKNGDRKRRRSGDQDKMVKRVKAEQPAATPSAKSTPVEPPSSSAVPEPTPSKKPSAKTKDKKKAKTKDKKKAKTEQTPKPATETPPTVKQTPVPLPTYPMMKR